MNIYDFISSHAIANYCKKIKHDFSPLECAYLVEQSDKTLEEKHTAWREIIKIMPDCDFTTSAGQTFHLREYLTTRIQCDLEIEKEFFRVIDGDYSYFYIYFDENKKNWNRDFDYHDNFEKAVKVFKEDTKNRHPQRMIIGKNIYIDDVEYTIWSTMDLAGKVLFYRVACSDMDLLERDYAHLKHYVYLNALHWVDIRIPTPFKKGDLLYCLDMTNLNPYNLNSIPVVDPAFVLTSDIKYAKAQDDQYIPKFNGCFVGYNRRLKTLEYSSMDTILSFDYPTKKPTGIVKNLTLVSDYLKGKLDIADLVNCSGIVNIEQVIEEAKEEISDKLRTKYSI